ncbi:hypothetical protein H2204_000400 [Knufia peltigerae]|uniref:Xylanolytic transcriptional activator regulatory domain-containing protein n=1 Tax=Knufia peltigerae TaxID=1002370 RepID=A0AA38YEK5_9EURO|nr:hypothetical protein H2204_000400 [Knufia peltigerae]
MEKGVPCSKCTHSKRHCFTSKPRKLDRAQRKPQDNLSLVHDLAPKADGIVSLNNSATEHGDIRGSDVSRCSLIKRKCQTPITREYLSSYLRAQEKPWLTLPGFIESPALHLDQSTLEYLAQQGAFNLPPEGIRNEFLKCFVDYVQPFGPVLDVRAFVRAIQQNDPYNPISLSLLWAVVFAASSFIDIDHLRLLGFNTRRSARQHLYRLVKLLYSFDVAGGPTARLQIALLLTFGYETPDDLHDAWYWLGVAITWAKTLGAHCVSSGGQPRNPRNNLLRRLWWSCWVRDRIITIGLRRPMHIKTGVPELDLDDFDLAPTSQDITKTLGLPRSVKDSNTITKLARITLALGSLCEYIGDIFNGLFLEGTGSAKPKQEAEHSQCKWHSLTTDINWISQMNKRLEDWLSRTAQEVQLFAPGSLEVINDEEDSSILIVHRAMLVCLYYTISTTLYRSQFLDARSAAIRLSALQELSLLKVQVAADRVFRVYMNLKERALIQFLPHMGVVCLIPATLAHLLESQTNDRTARKMSLQKAQSCVDILHELSQTYASAEYAILNLMIAKGRICGSLDVSDKEEEPGITQPQIVSSLLQSMTMSTEERHLLSYWLLDTDINSFSQIESSDMFNLALLYGCNQERCGGKREHSGQVNSRVLQNNPVENLPALAPPSSSLVEPFGWGQNSQSFAEHYCDSSLTPTNSFGTLEIPSNIFTIDTTEEDTLNFDMVLDKTCMQNGLISSSEDWRTKPPFLESNLNELAEVFDFNLACQ